VPDAFQLSILDGNGNPLPTTDPSGSDAVLFAQFDQRNPILQGYGFSNGSPPPTIGTGASDTTPPVITPNVSGTAGANGWYTTDVTVSWSVTDPESGISASTGCSATTVTNDTSGMTFTCSATNGAGLQTSRSVTIKIDKTGPRISCAANPDTLWPPNGKPVAVTISGTASDVTSGFDVSSARFAVIDEYGQVQPKGSVIVGGRGSYLVQVSLIADRNGSDNDGRKYTVVISGNDNAGNPGACSAIVTVPHDRGN
jgi:hypothetical protein